MSDGNLIEGRKRFTSRLQHHRQCTVAVSLILGTDREQSLPVQYVPTYQDRDAPLEPSRYAPNAANAKIAYICCKSGV